jgi:excisionase family DNA binding protein
MPSVAIATSPLETKRLLSPQEAADLLGVEVVTIRRWMVSGDLPSFRISKKTSRIAFEELQAWLGAKRWLARISACAEAPED